jgi:hypothetical protein
MPNRRAWVVKCWGRFTALHAIGMSDCLEIPRCGGEYGQANCD